jgi:hypothetical protein
VRRNLSVVFICTSFMTKNVEYFFTYFLVICTSENFIFIC